MDPEIQKKIEETINDFHLQSFELFISELSPFEDSKNYLISLFDKIKSEVTLNTYPDFLIFFDLEIEAFNYFYKISKEEIRLTIPAVRSPILRVLTNFIISKGEEINSFSESSLPSLDFIRELNEVINNKYKELKSGGINITNFLNFIASNALYQENLAKFLFWQEDSSGDTLGSFKFKDLNISEEDKAKLLQEWQENLEALKGKILECANYINSISETPDNKEAIDNIKQKISLINTSEGGEANNPLYTQIITLLRTHSSLLKLDPKCLEAIECYEAVMARKPLLITPPVSPDVTSDKPAIPEEVPRDNACKEWEDYWGVKFIYKSQNIDGTGKAECVEDLMKLPSSEPKVSYTHEWILTLLPAMRSALSKSGSVDVPNAMPGLQFQVRSSIAKHKIPGFQPLYQHMGVDSVIVTMVGCFTGDGGLSKIIENRLSPLDANTSNLKRGENGLSIDSEETSSEEGFTLNAKVGSRQALPSIIHEPSYQPWDQRENQINPISHPITQATENRVLRNLYIEPYRFGGSRPKTVQDSTEYPGFKDAIMYGYSTSKEARKGGMFMRDGCPWSCDDEYSGEGRQPTNQNNADVTNTHTLLELAAYNDSYHEFTSFYRVAVEQGHEMEIEINMRQNNDHLNPQQNRFLKYGKDATGKFGGDSDWGPLRNGDNGNPKFKGVIKALETYHARSDRTWYVMQIEVTDYGLIGKDPINLTNNLEAETMKALEATRAFVAQQESDESVFGSDEEKNACAETLITQAGNSYITLNSENYNERRLYFYGGYGIIRSKITTNIEGEKNEKSTYEILSDPGAVISAIKENNGTPRIYELYLFTFNSENLGKDAEVLKGDPWSPESQSYITLAEKGNILEQNRPTLRFHISSKTLIRELGSNVIIIKNLSELSGFVMPLVSQDKLIPLVSILLSESAITQINVDTICNLSSTSSDNTPESSYTPADSVAVNRGGRSSGPPVSTNENGTPILFPIP